MYIHVYVYIYMYCTCTYMHMYMYIHVRMYKTKKNYACLCTCMHVYSIYMYNNYTYMCYFLNKPLRLLHAIIIFQAIKTTVWKYVVCTYNYVSSLFFQVLSFVHCSVPNLIVSGYILCVHLCNVVPVYSYTCMTGLF